MAMEEGGGGGEEEEEGEGEEDDEQMQIILGHDFLSTITSLHFFKRRDLCCH